MPAIKRSYASRRTTGGSALKRSNAMPIYRRGSSSNPTGVVSAKATDLAKTKGPFPLKKWISFEYSYGLADFAPAAAIGTISVAPNDMYDFDKETVMGNKQPLYFDALLSSSGPYKTFYVDSWVTQWTVINTSTVPITVYAIPPVSASTEIDVRTEADNFPGVKKYHLTAKGGSRDICYITQKGHINDVYPSYNRDLTLTGFQGASPQALVYQGLVFASSDNSTAVTASVAVRHTAHTELANIDAIVS